MIGLAALEVLGDLADTAEVRASAIEQLRLAWEDHTLFGDAPAGTVPFQELRGRWTEQPDLDKPLVVVLMWALERISDGLPGSPDRVLGALGLSLEAASPPDADGPPPDGHASA